MRSILVKDYMDHTPNAVKVDTNIRDVIEILLKAGVTGSPVIDANEALVGFVSEQDCIKEMLNDAFYCEEPSAVSTVMSNEVSAVTPDTSIVELAQKLLVEKPRVYPVVDNGKLVGVIKRSQVLKALVDNDEDCYLHH
jgi:predicted transcriptional regulator